MRVLLDNNVNYRFGRLLPEHQVTYVQDIGWEQRLNGELIRAAEEAGFEVLITADKQMRHQQNLGERCISVILLNSLLLKWDYIAPLAPQVEVVLASLKPGSFIVVGPD